MTKQEIARQRGCDLTSTEIDVLCHIWTNTPKWECSEEEKYVNLGVPPTEDCPCPVNRIFIAIDLANDGLLMQHKEDINKFRLSEAGEQLHSAFYQ